MDGIAPNSEGVCKANPAGGADAIIPVTEPNVGQKDSVVKEKMQKK